MVNDYNFLGAAVNWIEGHEHTVNLLMWITAAVAAWLLGVFRAVREWARRPDVGINPAYSHCYCEEHATLGTHNDVALLVFVLDVAVSNPKNSPLAVRSFALQIGRTAALKRWTTPVKAIGFPSMPRTPMPGNAIKVVPIWLTTFEEYDASLCLKRVDPCDSAAGLTFFAAVIPKADIPAAMQKCAIKLTVMLATGEKCTAKGIVDVKTDLSHLERRVPTSLDYVRHKSVWTHCA
jgi:hypothetical protein